MTKFEMSEGTPSVAPAMTLEHTAFPHLTTVEWQALHRLAAVSGEFVVTSLLSSATPDQQRQAIQEFMERELAEAKRRVPTPSHSSRNDAVKMERSAPTEPLVPRDRHRNRFEVDRSADGESQLPVVSPLRKGQGVGPWQARRRPRRVPDSGESPE
ncbi:hypothetical protein PF003_g27556 [Phytophthora fragariae]|nr:hypothetical protein PF003_g27556 [Phytophthora fragariae]